MPLVSIGVPVFNGATLIGECLEHLAGQTFRDFEVIISDNASTDGTNEICEAFAQKDKRFRIIRRETTSTAMENFLSVRREATSPFYMWRAFDDLSTPNYIETLIGLHKQNLGIALAVPDVIQRYGACKPDKLLPYRAPPRLKALQLLQRMRQMKAGWFYGLWTLDAASRATDEVYDLFPDSWGADYLALFHAMLNGGIAGTNDCAFYQQILVDVRDYIPRPKPPLSEMIDRNHRFAATCRVLMDRSDLTNIESMVVRSYLPFFTNRCSHRAKRLFQAAKRRSRE